MSLQLLISKLLLILKKHERVFIDACENCGRMSNDAEISINNNSFDIMASLEKNVNLYSPDSFVMCGSYALERDCQSCPVYCTDCADNKFYIGVSKCDKPSFNDYTYILCEHCVDDSIVLGFGNLSVDVTVWDGTWSYGPYGEAGEHPNLVFRKK